MKKHILRSLGLVMTATMLFAGCSSSSSTYGKYMELGEYKGLDVSMIKSEITDDYLEEEIEYLLDEYTEYEEADRAAEDGDMVNINYAATVDGEEFDGSSEEEVDIEIGMGYLEDYFLEDAEPELIGMKAGDTKTVTLSISEDYYDEAIAGKDVDVELTVNSVYDVVRPEFNDEFVASISDFTTTDEYKEDLKASLLSYAEESNQYTAGSDALALVIENSTFNSYPEELYTECETLYNETNEMYAEMLGMDVSYFELGEEETKETIESMVYEEMVIATIAEKEKITVSDEEYTSYVESIMEDYEASSVEEFESMYDKNSTMDEILREKVQEFLLENANITEVSEEEYYGEEYSEDYYEEDDLEASDEEVIDLELDAAEEEPAETDTEVVEEE